MAGDVWPRHGGGTSIVHLAITGYHDDGGAVAIPTSGTAILRISLLTPLMARVQIFPTGIVTTNPSPAVAQVMPPLTDRQVLSQDDTLIIKAAGLSLHLAKAHLRADAYEADDKNSLSLEGSGDGTIWDITTGALRQTRVLPR